MSYTLITAQGQIMQFHVLAVAELYQGFKGGVIVAQDILVDTTVETQYN